MKKGLILALLVLLACSQTVFAAPSQQISVTVTITQSVSVSVTPTSYAFGATGEGSTVETAVDAFTATNDGNGTQNLTITVGSSTNWTAGSSTGDEVFVMNYHNGTAWGLIDPSTGAVLSSGLAQGASVSFGLQLLVPSSTAFGGVEQAIAVTVTASAS